MERYLKPTRLSDSDHPALQAKARELAANTGNGTDWYTNKLRDEA